MSEFQYYCSSLSMVMTDINWWLFPVTTTVHTTIQLQLMVVIRTGRQEVALLPKLKGCH